MPKIQVINPATGEQVRTYDEMSSEDVNTIIEQAHATWMTWRNSTFAERAEKMRMAATLLRDRSEEYARLMTEEMGKPIAQGRAEVEKCAWVCEYYAENAEAFLAPEPVETDATKSFVAFRPMGVVLAVMPWNFPFWQVFRFAAPVLMAGNGGVLKHASNVPGCALAIEEVFRDAGFPEGIFRSLLIPSKMVQAVIEHDHIVAVTLTGSTPAGQAVAQQAGAVLKKTVLELGGSDPYIVLEDADLELAAQTCAASRVINSGQSCIAAKRFIVVEAVRQRFEALFVGQMQAQKMGDPTLEDTLVGPQARTELRDDLHDQVERSIKSGARLLLGGKVPEGAGAFYPPTVLTDVVPGMAAFEEETFGPVAAIIPAKDEAEAIRLANSSIFGLGAAVFTQDMVKGERIATEELDAGSCFVNALVKSDPRLPFGGIKTSGYGRELAAFGIREFVNIKTVFVKDSTPVPTTPTE